MIWNAIYFLVGWFSALLVISIPFTFIPNDSNVLEGPRFIAVAIGLHCIAIAAGVGFARWQGRRNRRANIE
jgi:hypothetical protein